MTYGNSPWCHTADLLLGFVILSLISIVHIWGLSYMCRLQKKSQICTCHLPTFTVQWRPFPLLREKQEETEVVTMFKEAHNTWFSQASGSRRLPPPLPTCPLVCLRWGRSHSDMSFCPVLSLWTGLHLLPLLAHAFIHHQCYPFGEIVLFKFLPSI